MHRTIIFLLAGLVFLFGSLSAHAQQPESTIHFEVSEPPSGSLDRDQLEQIAGTIRQLERHPLAEGADEARATLVQWLQASPDVEVSMCPAIASPLVENESPALRRAMMQHLLSTAAYTIEHPETDDLVAAKLSGLEGALRVFETGRQKTGGAERIKQLLQLREEGKLKQYVEQGVERCRDTG